MRTDSGSFKKSGRFIQTLVICFMPEKERFVIITVVLYRDCAEINGSSHAPLQGAFDCQ